MASAMVPSFVVRQRDYHIFFEASVKACEACELTSCNQTGGDLVEEHIVFKFWLLG